MDTPVYDELFGQRAKRAVNSKSKGDRNEVVAAKFLSLWTGYTFKRVPRSGGLGWGRSFAVGDVVCITENVNFPFAVETKHYKDIVLTGSLRQNSIVHRFWLQAKRDADIACKEPLLMLRCNGMASGKFIIFFSSKVVFSLLASCRVSCIASGVFDGVVLQGYDSNDVILTDYKMFKENLK